MITKKDGIELGLKGVFAALGAVTAATVYEIGKKIDTKNEVASKILKCVGVPALMIVAAKPFIDTISQIGEAFNEDENNSQNDGDMSFNVPADVLMAAAAANSQQSEEVSNEEHEEETKESEDITDAKEVVDVDDED